MIEVSRTTKQFREMMDKVCSWAEQRGFDVDRPNGWKGCWVLVFPALFDNVKELLSHPDTLTLRNRHVLTHEPLVQIIRDLLEELPSDINVRVKKISPCEALFGDYYRTSLPISVSLRNRSIDARRPHGMGPSTGNRSAPY